MIKFFVLDGLLSGVGAVSPDAAQDSAFAPSCFARPSGQLPSAHSKRLCGSRQAQIVHHAFWVLRTIDCLETLMIMGKPAFFVSAFLAAVDAAMREHQPNHAMSVTPRTWLACCVTAVLVTNSMCWARFERASLGTYAMAALSWMFRQRKMPWDPLLVASVRVILRHHGLTSGSLVIDDTDNQRSNRPRHSPIALNCAIKKVVAIFGDKAWSFSSW